MENGTAFGKSFSLFNEFELKMVIWLWRELVIVDGRVLEVLRVKEFFIPFRVVKLAVLM